MYLIKKTSCTARTYLQYRVRAFECELHGIRTNVFPRNKFRLLEKAKLYERKINEIQSTMSYFSILVQNNPNISHCVINCITPSYIDFLAKMYSHSLFEVLLRLTGGHISQSIQKRVTTQNEWTATEILSFLLISILISLTALKVWIVCGLYFAKKIQLNLLLCSWRSFLTNSVSVLF